MEYFNKKHIEHISKGSSIRITCPKCGAIKNQYSWYFKKLKCNICSNEIEREKWFLSDRNIFGVIFINDEKFINNGNLYFFKKNIYEKTSSLKCLILGRYDIFNENYPIFNENQSRRGNIVDISKEIYEQNQRKLKCKNVLNKINKKLVN